VHVPGILTQRVIVVPGVSVKAIEVVPSLRYIAGAPVLIQVLSSEEGVVAVLLQDVRQSSRLQEPPPVRTVAATTHGIVAGAVIVRIHSSEVWLKRSSIHTERT